MEKIDLQGLLRVAGEIDAVSFLQEVITFVKEVSPILESMNISIKESVSKMPSASKKLSKVTEATEVATNDMLNMIDGLFIKTGDISSNLSKVPEKNEYIDKSNDILLSVNDDLTNLMMSLQVQDITSQQIAAVNYILENIQNKLENILSRFKTKEISSILKEELSSTDKNITTLHRQIAFDPNALEAITSKQTRQDTVDGVIQKINDGTLSEADSQEDISDFDIDAMFNNNDDSIKKVAFNEEQPSQDAEDFSQDDIDAMFANM